MAKKLSKDAVGYEPRAAPGARCAQCEHFAAPDACALVAGRISPRGWCRKFHREGAEEAREKAHHAHLVILLTGKPK
jgi:hypothetical protein